MMSVQLISQEFFDEMLLENQDVFDYDDDNQAVAETVKELQDQQQRSASAAAAAAAGALDKHSTTLDYLSLTHPDSEVGKHDRAIQKKFIECFAQSNNSNDSSSTPDLDTALSVVQKLSQSNKLPMAWSLIVQHKLFVVSNGGTAKLDVDDNTNTSTTSRRRLLTDLTLALVPSNISIQDQLCKAVKLQLASQVWFSSASDSAGDESSRWFTCLAAAAAAAPSSSAESHPSTSATATDPLLLLLLLQVGQKLCNGTEKNKKAFIATAMKFRPSTFSPSLSSCNNGLELFVQKCLVVTDDCWSSASSAEADTEDGTISVVREACQLLSVLCKFQPIAEQAANATASPGEPPLVSSAHANVKEFQKAGALPKLYRIVDSCLTQEEKEEQEEDDSNSLRRARSLLVCDAMTALRVMAIDNDIVQNMVALGILDVVKRSLQMAVRDIRGDENGQESAPAAATTKQQNLAFVAATFGLVRNLCANDEIKTTICKSSLGSILALMQHFQVPNVGQDQRQQQQQQQQQQLLQEHACGILAAMALKQPQNASSICDSNSNNGHMLILDAMQLYPQCVTLQRQACLAVRNIASRIDPPLKQIILDAGAERIIQQYAGCHQGSVEEAYAALRDLGCNPKIRTLDDDGNLKGTEEFGKVKSNFRAVYE